MEYHIERLGKCMEDLKGVSVPVLKVKEDADKTDDDSKAKILDF